MLVKIQTIWFLLQLQKNKSQDRCVIRTEWHFSFLEWYKLVSWHHGFSQLNNSSHPQSKKHLKGGTKETIIFVFIKIKKGWEKNQPYLERSNARKLSKSGKFTQKHPFTGSFFALTTKLVKWNCFCSWQTQKNKAQNNKLLFPQVSKDWIHIFRAWGKWLHSNLHVTVGFYIQHNVLLQWWW